MAERIQIEPTRVQLDLTTKQAELLRDCLFTQTDQDVGRRSKLLALHEEIMGALSRVTQQS